MPRIRIGIGHKLAQAGLRYRDIHTARFELFPQPASCNPQSRKGITDCAVDKFHRGPLLLEWSLPRRTRNARRTPYVNCGAAATGSHAQSGCMDHANGGLIVAAVRQVGGVTRATLD